MSIQLVYALAACLSALSAVLAWLAKLKWSKEYIAAKDEIVKAKEAQIVQLNGQIKQLQDLTPMKIEEYFHSVTLQMTGHIDFLKAQLKEAETQNIESTKEHQDEIERLQAELNEARSISNELAKSTPPIRNSLLAAIRYGETHVQRYHSLEVPTPESSPQSPSP